MFGGNTNPTQESVREEKPALFDNSPKSLINGSQLYKLNRFRMILLLHSVENIPSNLDTVNKNYFIDFTVFGTKIRYKLDLVENAVWGNDPNANFERRINKLNKSNSQLVESEVQNQPIMGPGYHNANRKHVNDSTEAHGMGTKNYNQSTHNLSQDPHGKSGSLQVIINRLKCFYFFSEERLGLTNYINKQKNLKMHLYCEEDLHDGTRGKKVDLMGEIEFELTDFLSDKIKKREFYKYFSGSLSKIPILSWGVKFTIGIVPSNPQDFSDCIDDDDELERQVAKPSKVTLSGLPEPVDIEKVSLKNLFGIYVPNQYYFAYEPLPLEWMRMIKRSEVIHQQRAFKIENPAHGNQSMFSAFGMKGLRNSQKENNKLTASQPGRRSSQKILESANKRQCESWVTSDGKAGDMMAQQDEASTFDEDKLLEDELKEYDNKLYSRIL